MSGPTTTDIPTLHVEHFNRVTGERKSYTFETKDGGRAGLLLVVRSDVSDHVNQLAQDELCKAEAAWWEAQP